ncbi:pitrilysin family protein [Streptomyces sp. NPDC005322]|uniref:M16 family metallopeptidase n=1 Tax=Streptomyces sp. NPDC005322 TaxID=3157032 RepID=UPI0033B67D4A
MPTDTISRYALSNGLRVILCHRPLTPLAAVSVHYGVGFRSEPEGRGGFAHLFEHLMFQGSANVARSEHFRIVQSSGGTANGSTRQDYTEYYQIAPASALERLLFLEADRMRAPRFTGEALATQMSVVKEEIRLNVHDRAYGGFPWTALPSALYQKFSNAHNGYGDFTDLARATPDDCAAFFDAYYTPSNAVLTVAGALDPERTRTWVDRHFGDIPPRTAAAAQDLGEPHPSATVRHEHTDPHAPLPATALGYRLPDAAADRDGYLAHMVLAHLLAGDGPGSLRHRARDAGVQLAALAAQCGFFGPFDARAPDTFVVSARHPAPSDELLQELTRGALDELAADGTLPRELADTTGRLAARWRRTHGNLLARTRALGAYHLLHDDAGLVDSVPGRLTAIGPAAVRAAAAALGESAPAVLAVRPGTAAVAA